MSTTRGGSEATPVRSRKHARCRDRCRRRANKCSRRRRAGWDLGARAPLCLAPLWQASARRRPAGRRTEHHAAQPGRTRGQTARIIRS
eukprot:7376549-Prymnesium_polylepis.1